MRNFTRPVLLSLLIILSFSVVSAQSPSSGSTSQKKAIEVKFPDVSGWEKGGISGSVTQPAGLIAPYNSETGAIATVYVYDREIQAIPNNLTGVVSEEFALTKDTLYKLEKMGVYENVKEVKSETTTLGGAKGKVKTLHAIYTLKMKGNEVVSEIFIFPYKNYFVKIRLTQPQIRDKAIENEISGLMVALDASFTQ